MIPEKAIVSRERYNKQRNAEWIKKVGNYHKEILNEYYNGQLTDNKNENIDTLKDSNQMSIENDNFKICSRFSSILAMKYLNPEPGKDSKLSKERLLVIENDWNKIIKTLPDAIMTSSYKS